MVDLSPNKKKVYYLILFIFFKSFIASIIGMEDVLNLVADILVFYLVYRQPKKHFAQLKRALGYKLIGVISFFFFIGILSGFVNYVPIQTILWGVRLFIRYFFLFYVLFFTFDKTDIPWFKKFLYKIFTWNSLACIYQLYNFRTGDGMGGIAHNNGELAILLVVLDLFFCMEYLSGNISKYSLIGRFLMTIFISMWAEIKLLYFILPLCLYSTYVLVKKTSFVHVIVLVLASLFFVPTMKFILSFYYSDEYIEKTFDSDEIVTEISHDRYNLAAEGVSFNRNTCIKKTQETFLLDPIHNAIGWGIGSGTNSSRFKTWINYQYEQTAYFFFTSSYVLIETGWIGFVSFLLIYAFIMLRFLHYYILRKDQSSKYWASIGIILCGMTFLFIWYNDTPYAYYYIPFIIWSFCFIALRKEVNYSESIINEKIGDISDNKVRTELVQ